VEAIPLERIARREFSRLAKGVARVGAKPDDAALHGLRISLKRARYAAELSSPDTKSARRFLDRAKALQTLLGEHQDSVQAEERLRSAAVMDARTAAAFVAGRIAERQLARRAQLREQLPAAWRRLRKSASHLLVPFGHDPGTVPRTRRFRTRPGDCPLDMAPTDTTGDSPRGMSVLDTARACPLGERLQRRRATASVG
jgi:hypothetical protein